VAVKGLSRRYRERAAALAAAIDVGAELAPQALVASAALWRRIAVEPAIGHDTMAGLAALEEAFFTYWNETDGEHVERFWARVAERGLPFTRSAPIRAMIERGGIRTAIERDGLVALVAERRRRRRGRRGAADRESRLGGAWPRARSHCPAGSSISSAVRRRTAPGG
jgi:hypothetical protein